MERKYLASLLAFAGLSVGCNGKLLVPPPDDAQLADAASDVAHEDVAAVPAPPPPAACSTADGGSALCPATSPVCLTLVGGAVSDGGVMYGHQCIAVPACNATSPCSCYTSAPRPAACSPYGGTVTCKIVNGSVYLQCPNG